MKTNENPYEKAVGEIVGIAQQFPENESRAVIELARARLLLENAVSQRVRLEAGKQNRLKDLHR